MPALDDETFGDEAFGDETFGEEVCDGVWGIKGPDNPTCYQLL